MVIDSSSPWYGRVDHLQIIVGEIAGSDTAAHGEGHSIGCFLEDSMHKRRVASSRAFQIGFAQSAL